VKTDTGRDSITSTRTRRSTRFNPRAPRGARHLCRDVVGLVLRVSTHAPRAGRDRTLAVSDATAGAFQPTRPARGATASICRSPPRRPVSTHAPRAGRDIISCALSRAPVMFQPTRPARGATRSARGGERGNDKFQPTRPARGATASSEAIVSERHCIVEARTRQKRSTGRAVIPTAPP